ncbi:terminase small subunit [Paenibacillus gorillae]|uniref:terminase small subunit n=1 Tax=Paenibacillus gorillae TaxID=1243662 RepID=UPI0004B87C37|nr:terminase small subunit [Paenibacillus gorillae]
MKLTEKQKRFADYFVESGNASESAVRAGYSAKTAREMGHENLSKPIIREYIDALIAKKDEARIAKQDEVLEFLTDVMRGKVTEKIPLGLGMGEQALVKNELEGKDRIKAAELLGKRYGTWVDKQEVKGQVVVFKGEDDLPD